MTNYEKIKNMSVQEMADMLDDIDDISAQPCDPRYCEGYGDGINCSHENREKHCRQAIVNWLNSEVVESDEGDTKNDT